MARARAGYTVSSAVSSASLVAAMAIAASIGLSAALSAQEAVKTTVVLPEGPGKKEFAASCARCHALGTAMGKRRDADGWSQIMARMKKVGLIITPRNEAIVYKYLTKNFAAQGEASNSAIAASSGPESGPPKVYPRPAGPAQWPTYGGSGANLNYSPLQQITPANVANLKPAWVYHYGTGQSMAGDQGLDYRFQTTPLMIGNVLYISTPSSPLKPDLKSSVTALEPETGEVLWKYESPLNIHGRGLAYWPGDAENPPRLIFGTDRGMIVAIDVTTGKPAKGFGRGGQIDAYVGVASEIVGDSRRSSFTIPNPVTIYKNLIITAARPGEAGPPAPRGDIRAWDARTGRLVWTFHTIPQPGEANHEGWQGDEWRDVSGANVWSTMALDEANGLLIAPTGDANSGASGSQLYSDSIVALDAATGKLRWFRQLTHHDIWDWDAPTPPALADLQIDGKTVPAVLVTGKLSLFFMFNRLTGEPLNGFTEKPTPQPETPSAEVWPTQPFPDAPGPLSRTSMRRDEIPDLAPGMGDFCRKFWDDNAIVSRELYAPRQSSKNGVVSYPSPTGGPNWGGGSYHPGLDLYFINMQNRPVFRPKTAEGAGYAMMARNGPAGGDLPPRRPAGPRPQQGFTYKTAEGVTLSCGATPWGELVAVDVAKRSIAWRVPLGITEALGKKGLNTGAPNLGGNLVTKSGVVFIGATNDRRLRAFDAKSGKRLWETQLEASAHATPISYMGADGKQYIVVAAGGGTTAGGPEMSDTLVAYKLP